MIARITRFRIRSGKVEEFAATAESLMAAMDKLDGFRLLLILRGEDPGGRDAISISVWDSAEQLKSSENDKFYYGGLARLMSCCESFSPMHQHEVLKSKFAKP
jgi:heme-degrading monooxygenase HmoA